MHSKEADCLIMSFFSYISIALTGHNLYLDALRPKGILQSHEIRFFTYIIVELNIFISTWKYFEKKNSEKLIQIFCLHMFFIINITRKSSCGKRFVLVDLIVFFCRIFHLIWIMDRLRTREVCSHCKTYSIEENMHQILKLRSVIKILKNLYFMFTIMTFIYIAMRGLIREFFLYIFINLLIYFLEINDKNERLPLRIAILTLYFLSFLENVKILAMLHHLKE